MSSIASECPKCGDIGPLRVIKEESLKDWSVCCLMCKWVGEPGYYWTIQGITYEQHREEMGWDDEN